MAVQVIGTSVGHRQGTAAQVRVLREGTGEEVFAALLQQGWQLAEPDEDVWAPQGETFLDDLAAVGPSYIVMLSTNLAVENPIFEQSADGRKWRRHERIDALSLCSGDTLRFRARWQDYVSGEVILVGQAERKGGRLPPDVVGAARRLACP